VPWQGPAALEMHEAGAMARQTASFHTHAQNAPDNSRTPYSIARCRSPPGKASRPYLNCLRTCLPRTAGTSSRVRAKTFPGDMGNNFRRMERKRIQPCTDTRFRRHFRLVTPCVVGKARRLPRRLGCISRLGTGCRLRKRRPRTSRPGILHRRQNLARVCASLPRTRRRDCPGRCLCTPLRRNSRQWPSRLAASW
jgi:hypothetical protein